MIRRRLDSFDEFLELCQETDIYLATTAIAVSSALLFAVFVGPDCPDCARAVDDLRALAENHSLWVQVFDRKLQPGLADRLGVDTLPFYVFPRMMLRGAIPAPVIARYLDRGTGQ